MIPLQGRRRDQARLLVPCGTLSPTEACVECAKQIQPLCESIKVALEAWWFSCGGFATEAMMIWLAKKTLLMCVLVAFLKLLPNLLGQVAKVANGAVAEKAPKNTTEAIMAAILPLRTAFISGVVLSFLHPAPIHLGVRLNNLIGREGCLIQELHVGPMIYTACACWWILKVKTQMIQQWSEDLQLTMESGVSLKEGLARIRTIDQVLSLAIVGGGVAIASEIAHLPLKAVLAMGGASGIAFAWASQQLLVNFLAGMVLRVSQIFSKGEVVKVCDGNVSGFVLSIGFYGTRIRNGDGLPVFVPNSKILGANIFSLSRAKYQNVSIQLGVRPEDFDKVRAISKGIKNALEEDPTVGPGPRANLADISPANGVPLIAISYTLDNPFLGQEDGLDTFLSQKAEIFHVTKKIIEGCGAQIHQGTDCCQEAVGL
ncbi:hypothetical protein CYMTET_12806 [Cymbomonas tetramitiformis]|uniref:Mechanosensitive ion channel MscS domain-containing protein n=1 Tax=Cymbomonas tetramitiformis TaxID=36881 RepID=A0AAE0LBT7_9CHLO|nr:hypothetical protein CYMTET_12806 [Cymbomonas tetramitiformis]